MHFVVDDFHRVFTEGTRFLDFASHKRIFIGHLVANRTEFVAHAPMSHHPTSHRRRTLEIVFRTDSQLTVDDGLGAAAGQQNDQVIKNFLLGQIHPLFVVHHLRHAKCLASRDDGYFVNRVATFEEPSRDRVASFMVSGSLFFLFGQDLFASSTHQDFVVSMIEIIHLDFVFVFSGGPQGSFIDEVLNVRTGHSCGCFGHRF